MLWAKLRCRITTYSDSIGLVPTAVRPPCLYAGFLPRSDPLINL